MIKYLVSFAFVCLLAACSREQEAPTAASPPPAPEAPPAELSEADLVAKVNKLKASAVEDSAAKVKLRELNRNVDANRRVYESFLLRSRETSEQEKITSKSARLISEAVPVAEKTGPNRKLMVAIGGAGGATLGAFLGLLPFFLRGLRQVAGGTGSDGSNFSNPIQPAGWAPSSHPVEGDLYSSADATSPPPLQMQPPAAPPLQTPITPQPAPPSGAANHAPSPQQVSANAGHVAQSTQQPAPQSVLGPMVYGMQMPLPGMAQPVAPQPVHQPMAYQTVPSMMVPQPALQPVQPQMIYTNWVPQEQK